MFKTITKKRVSNWFRIISRFLKLIKEIGLNAAINIEIIQFFKNIQYKHNYILCHFEKEYSEIINKYQQSRLPSEVIRQNCPVWVLWFQGEENMPETIRFCFESIKKYSGKRKVQLLTFENYTQFISLPPYIIEKVSKGIISLTHFSDIIRCNLLAEYGGIYIDAGLLLTADLQIPNLPFFSIKMRKPENDDSYVSDYRWVVGFMGGVKGNVLHSFIQDFYNEYWMKHNMVIDYFLLDYMISVAYNNIPSVKKMIDNVPYNNEECFYIQSHLFEPLNKEELEQALSRTSIFRIGYKGIPHIIQENSLYNYLFK